MLTHNVCWKEADSFGPKLVWGGKGMRRMMLGLFMATALLAIVFGSSNGTSPITGSQNAYAYANGTQIIYQSSTAYSACVSGTNQNGWGYECDNGTGHWVHLPTYDTYDYNWWWIGQIYIQWYGQSGNYIEGTWCNTNVTGAWVTCHGPFG
jgi:hypothetical protein